MVRQPLRSPTTETDSQDQSRRPDVSVLMPSFNAAQYLPATLASLDQQAPEVDWELIVQDAESTDRTLEILNAYAAVRPDRVHIYSERDDGQADALNRALSRASARWVLWLNADDVVLPGALRAISKAAQESPNADLIHGGFKILDASGSTLRVHPTQPWRWERFFARGCYIFSGSILWRRDFLESVGGWNSGFNYCMDFDLVLRVPREAFTVQVDDLIGALRWHDAAKSSTSGRRFIKESIAIRRRYVDSPVLAFRALLAIGLLALSTSISSLRYSRAYSAVKRSRQERSVATRRA